MSNTSTTVDFLRCVLPSEGYYVATVIKPHTRQIVCKTIEQLAQTILEEDKKGCTVYHACASFKDPKAEKVRGHANALWAKCLWLDLDAGPGKPYASAAHAYAAITEFCRSTKLPLPIIVGSGGGLHVYWPIREALTPDAWQPLAEGLKHLCLEHGLHADPSRTADISSILRTPGTHNRKRGEVLVQCGELPVRGFPIEDFKRLRSSGTPLETNVSSRVGRSISGISAAILSDSPSAFPGSDANKVADECAQLGAFRKSGALSEPRWHCGVGVTSRCIDGPAVTHEWSKNDFPDYSYAETQDKIDRWLALSGPTTCAQFDSVNPGVCQHCPHYGKITTPCQLGVISVDAPEVEGAPNTLSLPRLPDPFHWSLKKQMLFRREDNNGDGTNTIVTDHPVFLANVQTGEHDDNTHSYCFSHLLPKRERQITIDARTLHGPAGIGELAKLGVIVQDSKLFMDYVRKAVSEFHNTSETNTRFDQFGWKNDNTSFLCGKYLYTSVGPVLATGAAEIQSRCKWIGPKPRGSLTAWTEAADSLFAPQSEALSAAVLASFAAVLMKFIAPTEGGAMLHLCTPESGSGKTTALQGAWTVWGERLGLVLTDADTKVSKFIVLGVMGNLPVIYDELFDRDPEVVRKFIMIFTEGRDRLRGTTDGTIRHTAATWCTVHLSAANQSIIERVATGTDAAGFRVLELSCALLSGTDKVRGDQLRKMLEDNAGTAGHAFLRYLMIPEARAWAEEALQTWYRDIQRITNLSNEHRFRMRLVAAIAVAAAIVNKLEILHFNSKRIVDYLIEQLVSTGNQGTVTSIPSEQRAQAILGDFLNEYQDQRVDTAGPWKAKAPPQHPSYVSRTSIVMRTEASSKRLFISETVFRDWCLKHQVSAKETLATLKDKGVIVDYRRFATLTAGTGIPGAQVPCIEANLEHPAMSGIAAEVTRLRDQSEERKA